MLGLGYLNGYGGSQDFIGSTAAALGSSYDLRSGAMEGIGTTANGNAANVGLFSAKKADPSIKAYAKIYMARE